MDLMKNSLTVCLTPVSLEWGPSLHLMELDLAVLLMRFWAGD